MVGALWGSAVLLLVEPVASAVWLTLGDRLGAPRALFWLAAGVTGAVWGAWLGLAPRRSAAFR